MVARRWLTPTFADLVFAALLAALFGQRAAWMSLLADGDTGWHIRTGEWILAHGRVPGQDLFSFSRPGQPWFAWEWGADVLLAVLHGWRGLGAVAGFSACVLCAAAVVLFCWLLRRGCGLWLAAAGTYLAVSASSIHYLARPHIFSLLLFPAALWILDEDRRRPSPRVWWLVPLAALWANLHGGFAAWLVVLGLSCGAALLGRDRTGALRAGKLLGLSAAATLVNPYGPRLHLHILRYLGSSWIQDNVQEFQSPRIRSENMMVFAALLLGGVALVSRLWPEGRRFEALLLLGCGFAALCSARHVPLYAAAAAPVIGAECAGWWRRTARPRSLAGVAWELGRQLPARVGPSGWTAVVAAVLMALAPDLKTFPPERFPVDLVERSAALLAPGGQAPRVLTSDQWADYLIFRFYPRQRVFFDGRSDFYGPGLGRDYQVLLAAAPNWRDVFERHRFDLALLPADWPLGSVLEREPGWSVVRRDRQGILLARAGGATASTAAEGGNQWIP